MAPKSTSWTRSPVVVSPSRTRTPHRPAAAGPHSRPNNTPLDFSNLRPEGGKRSSKRDRILNIFLRQEGHLSADDLFDLVRRVEPGIGRATVYRTLQWMVGADIARKVDFGDGRSRYEPSYRHPRHFHLICTRCHQSSEFLSSDVE